MWKVFKNPPGDTEQVLSALIDFIMPSRMALVYKLTLKLMNVCIGGMSCNALMNDCTNVPYDWECPQQDVLLPWCLQLILSSPQMVNGPDQTAQFSALLQVFLTNLLVVITLLMLIIISAIDYVMVRIKIMIEILQAVGAPHGQWLPHTRWSTSSSASSLYSSSSPSWSRWRFWIVADIYN